MFFFVNGKILLPKNLHPSFLPQPSTCVAFPEDAGIPGKENPGANTRDIAHTRFFAIPRVSPTVKGIPEKNSLVKVAKRGVFQRCVETTLEASSAVDMGSLLCKV